MGKTLTHWFKSGLTVCAMVAVAVFSYAPAVMAGAIPGTSGPETFEATGTSGRLKLLPVVVSSDPDSGVVTTVTKFASYSRVEVWAFRTPFIGAQLSGTMLLRWDPSRGGITSPLLGTPSLADGNYHLTVIGYSLVSAPLSQSNPICRRDTRLNDLSSQDTSYCNYEIAEFDNFQGSLRCVAGKCTTVGSPAALPDEVVPEPGQWWSSFESGRGYLIEVRNGYIGMIYTGYNDSGRAVWYIMSAPYNASSGTATGQLSELGGGQTITGPYISPTIANGGVGQISVQFSDSTSGVLTLPDGRLIAISKQSW